jgi:hypothetical protein
MIDPATVKAGFRGLKLVNSPAECNRGGAGKTIIDINIDNMMVLK